MTRYAGLTGRIAIVTGGATGIGASISRSLCEQGVSVAIVDIADDAGRDLSGALNAAYGTARGTEQCAFFSCDLRDIAALRETFAASQERLGPASILVNNAAVDRREDFESVEPDEFDFMIGVNLRHVYFACQAIVPQMRETGGGAIVNMSSGAWIAGSPDSGCYVASKAAIVGLTNSLARLLGDDDIRVNAIAPGAVRTERQMRLWHTEASMQAVIGQQCIKRQLLPEHIANSVLFLASDDGAMITKQLILVNAGLR